MVVSFDEVSLKTVHLREVLREIEWRWKIYAGVAGRRYEGKITLILRTVDLSPSSLHICSVVNSVDAQTIQCPASVSYTIDEFSQSAPDHSEPKRLAHKKIREKDA